MEEQEWKTKNSSRNKSQWKKQMLFPSMVLITTVAIYMYIKSMGKTVSIVRKLHIFPYLISRQSFLWSVIYLSLIYIKFMMLTFNTHTCKCIYWLPFYSHTDTHIHMATKFSSLTLSYRIRKYSCAWKVFSMQIYFSVFFFLFFFFIIHTVALSLPLHRRDDEEST